MSSISPSRRRQSEKFGRQAEGAVAASWQARGYDVLGQRMRTPAGEIDLVVANNETLIFVEVKARRSFADAAYAVQAVQQRRLLAAAGSVMALHPDWCREETRFDVALVCGGAIELIEDAIRP